MLAVLGDLAADHVLLLVQDALFGTRDVTSILRGHIALFLSDLPIVAVQLRRLRASNVTIATLGVDPAVLIIQPIVYLSASGV